MSVVKELIRTEADGGISFGDYELAAKAKKSDFEHRGDLYKVKTFRKSQSWRETDCSYTNPFREPQLPI